MKVGIIHPDLGIGGAERLVLDACVCLEEKGHDVVVYTSHFDPDRCFEEAKGLNIRVRGDFLPRNVFGFGHVFFASLRNLYAAFCFVLFERVDVVMADQVSTCVPVLRLGGLKKIVFYVHFPDKLLAVDSGGWLRQLYRWPFDLLEEITTSCAHILVVNSRFTAETFRRTFPRIDKRATVLYPSVTLSESPGTTERENFVVSLNRYERKKRIDLAIRALVHVDKMRLVVAGGYDVRVAENVEHYEELVELARSLRIEDRVTFERSISNERRLELLRSAHCLVYTPPNEHFGIVPIEAMSLGCPVVAANSGGPLETVADGKTGFLVDPSPIAFARAIEKIDDSMASAAVARVQNNFSREKFCRQLENILFTLPVA